MKKPGYGTYLLLLLLLGLLVVVSYLSQKFTSPVVEEGGHEHGQVEMPFC